MPANPNDPRVLAILRSLPAEKLTALAADLYRFALRTNEVNLHDRHPNWDDEHLRSELMRRCTISKIPYINPHATDDVSVRRMAAVGWQWDPRLRPRHEASLT